MGPVMATTSLSQRGRARLRIARAPLGTSRLYTLNLPRVRQVGVHAPLLLQKARRMSPSPLNPFLQHHHRKACLWTSMKIQQSLNCRQALWLPWKHCKLFTANQKASWKCADSARQRSTDFGVSHGSGAHLIFLFFHFAF